MPKIVNVEKKRLEIAVNSIDLFLQKGYQNLTVSEVAKNSRIAKGSVYKYFESKEDIVFAIIEYAQETYDKNILLKIENSIDIEEKILALFDLCISEDSSMIQRRRIYKEFMNLASNSDSYKMVQLLKDIKKKYVKWLHNIFQEGIDNGKLQNNALEFIDGLFVIGEGVLLFSNIDDYNKKDLLQNHVKSLLRVLKKDN